MTIDEDWNMIKSRLNLLLFAVNELINRLIIVYSYVINLVFLLVKH